MNVLHLPLKRKWFEMEACGEKKEEYREIKPYWVSRFVKSVYLLNRTHFSSIPEVMCDMLKQDEAMQVHYNNFDRIYAKNGYSKTSPIIHWEHLGITIGEPNPSWCEPQDVGKKVFILKIGDILYKS